MATVEDLVLKTGKLTVLYLYFGNLGSLLVQKREKYQNRDIALKADFEDVLGLGSVGKLRGLILNFTSLEDFGKTKALPETFFTFNSGSEVGFDVYATSNSTTDGLGNASVLPWTAGLPRNLGRIMLQRILVNDALLHQMNEHVVPSRMNTFRFENVLWNASRWDIPKVKRLNLSVSLLSTPKVPMKFLDSVAVVDVHLWGGTEQSSVDIACPRCSSNDPYPVFVLTDKLESTATSMIFNSISVRRRKNSVPPRYPKLKQLRVTDAILNLTSPWMHLNMSN